MRAGGPAATTASRQIGARLRPGSGDLALARKVIARLAPQADQHLLGVLQQPLDAGGTLGFQIVGVTTGVRHLVLLEAHFARYLTLFGNPCHSSTKTSRTRHQYSPWSTST